MPENDVCSICGEFITESDLTELELDSNGEPCHAWCLEDLQNQEEEAYE